MFILKPLWKWLKKLVKNGFVCSSWSILVHFLTSRIYSLFVICLRSTMWLSSLIKKALPNKQFFSVIFLKTLIASTAMKNRMLIFLKKPLFLWSSSLRDFWKSWDLNGILFAETLGSGFQELINQVILALKLLFKLVDILH